MNEEEIQPDASPTVASPPAPAPAVAAPPEPAPGPAPAAAAKTARFDVAKRLRLYFRSMPETTRRVLLIIAGALVLIASVLGFYYTSDALDERVPVLVSARDIAVGDTVSFADFTSDLALIGAIPHLPWFPDTPAAFEGMVAVQPIATGALVLPEMFVEAETLPVGVELEVVVPLDLSLATEEVSDGETVLLVDPGAEPAAGDDGRPRRVVREFKLTNFDGSQMRLFLPPEEWAEWTALLEDVGTTLMVKDLGLGAEAEETIERLDEVWLMQWQEAVDEVAQAEAAAEPAAGPGELEVIVSLDAGLAPSGVAEGDLVLMIDPGVAPSGGDAGRARSVIQTLELQNYAGGQMQMFVPPDEWVWWRALPERLGGTPLVLPVPDGTDVDGMIGRLDAEWQAAWRNASARAAAS